MQALFFEDAWERTISVDDRNKIQGIFEETRFTKGVRFAYLWQAKNHENASLVTVLIHNHRDEALSLERIKVQYDRWTESFTVPKVIPAYHSMPWTFIFNGDGIDGLADYVIHTGV